MTQKHSVSIASANFAHTLLHQVPKSDVGPTANQNPFNLGSDVLTNGDLIVQ